VIPTQPEPAGRSATNSPGQSSTRLRLSLNRPELSSTTSTVPIPWGLTAFLYLGSWLSFAAATRQQEIAPDVAQGLFSMPNLVSSEITFLNHFFSMSLMRLQPHFYNFNLFTSQASFARNSVERGVTTPTWLQFHSLSHRG
jgi:hypothetical protein